jgi:uncharacterized membrane protein YczE
MPRRVAQLLVGLALYGFGCGLTVAAGLGVDPWTVLAEGLSRRSGIGVGWVTNLLGALVLLAWIPLRQHPGIGTVANIAVVGTTMQITLSLVHTPGSPLGRVSFLAAGVIAVAIASGLYIGAHFGPGPRDGLMTGLHARLGLPIWMCRLAVEGTVLVLGWSLGGTVGVGTVVFAVCIGPLVHMALPLFDAPVRRARAGADTDGRAVSAPGTAAVRIRA